MPHTIKAAVLLIAIILISCGEKKTPEVAGSKKKSTEKEIAETDSSKTTMQEAVREKKSAITKPKTDSKQTVQKPEAEKTRKTSKTKIKSISELWKIYKKAKEKATAAIESGNIEQIVEQLEIAGESALQLGRDDIAAWQFNNIGHYSIEEFKKRTNYDDRIRAMATMSSGKEKSDFIRETKNLFNGEVDLLDQAKKNLEKAQIIDDELEKSRRTETIVRNLDFINWVYDFLD